MKFVERLVKKTELLILDNKVSTDVISNIEIEEQHVELYQSMKRWHVNCHISESQWRHEFDNIKSSLNVQELVTVPEDLKKYLKTKFAKSSLKERFAINEMLEFLVSDIREYYRFQQSNRDDEEFEVETYSIFTGMRPGDLMFFERSYLPLALFLTYMQIHPNSDRRSLMDDVFSIGAGSRCEDLLPEVTAVCSLCATRHGFKNVDEDFLDSYNIMVLRKQIMIMILPRVLVMIPLAMMMILTGLILLAVKTK